MLDAILSEYRLQDPDRGIVGPIGLETVAKLLGAGVVARSALVSRDGGPFQPLSAFEELADFVAGSDAATPSRRWDLADTAMTRVLFELHRRAETGLLVTRDGDLRKDIYLRRGEIVFYSSNIPSERFGWFLVNRGLLDTHDMRVALDSMHTDQGRFGETLLRLGLLEHDELADELREHNLERLIELCCWLSGRCEFHDGKKFEGEVLDLHVTVPHLILRAVREMPESMLEPLLEVRAGMVPARAAGDDVRDLFPFTELEWRVLDKLDGERPLAEILGAYAPNTEARRTTAATLYLVLALELVELRSP